MVTRPSANKLSIASALAAALLLPATAQAAFPGANGRIAYTNGNGVVITTVNPDGSGGTTISSGGDDGPRYSPDGKKIAFTRTVGGGNSDVYVMNADGSGVTQITSGPAIDGVTGWSPDGTKLLFQSDRDSSPFSYDVYVMNASGTGVTRLTTTPQWDVGASWSPDGTKIAFMSERDNPQGEIYTMDPDGSNQTRITTNSSQDHAPDWSPDGKRLAFSSIRDGDYEIHTMSPDGTDVQQLTINSPEQDIQPAWSPDGTKIVFARFVSGGFLDLYVMNADGGAQTQLTTDPQSDQSPNWQPTYQVPQSAQSISTALIPSYRQTISSTQCAARGGTSTTHPAPFAVPSCNPPGFLPGTIARFGIQAVGSATLTVVPGDPATVADEADHAITVDVSDLRSGSPTGPDYDPNPAGTDLTLAVKLRLTDSLNGALSSDPGTASDFEFRVPVDCEGSPDPAIGASCSASTSADSVMAGAVREGKNTLTSAFRLRVRDSGTNGTRGDADDREFAMQGLYTP